MLDFHTLAEFSRANCIGICAFLVPANLLTTLAIMTMTVLRFPLSRIWAVAVLAFLFAVVMILHVYTWFAVGIVMKQTYILLGLALTCLITNISALLLQITPLFESNRVIAQFKSQN